ncbi:MAG: DNA polymerase III subunit delta' [Betaproteobacteria bacterium]|nr:MAG: DNA polymerase III subunit delta' [Betaproteobacteria bacterium]
MFSWQDSAWNAWLPIRERLPHAILIRGAEGSGELEFAQEVAQSLLCEKPRGDRRGCGTCPACGWFAQGNHPDFRLLLPDSMAPEPQEEGAEPTKKEKRSEQIRIEQVRELAGFLAVGTHRAGLRVILIYPADAMNANTQNALLKSLEEPPPGTVFLLVSTQIDRLLPTVRSRCARFALPPPDPAQVTRWLKEQGVKQPEAALAGAGGAPLAALKAAESEADRLRFIEGLGDPGFDPIALAEAVLRVPPWDLVGWLQRWSYDLLLARVAGRIQYHVDHEGVIADTSRNCEAADIAAYLRALAQARSLARHPLNAKLFVEDLLLQYQRLIARP